MPSPACRLEDTPCSPFAGCPRRASCTGNSPRKATFGASASSCGRSLPTGSNLGFSWGTMRWETRLMQSVCACTLDIWKLEPSKCDCCWDPEGGATGRSVLCTVNAPTPNGFFKPTQTFCTFHSASSCCTFCCLFPAEVINWYRFACRQDATLQNGPDGFVLPPELLLGINEIQLGLLL